ncbi:MAG: SET domain-containing protein [Acidobacteriota bacterium]
MLLVKTQVDKSPIHGLGLFAAEPIAKGTPIWRFTPGLDLDLDTSVLDVQPAAFRKRLLHYGYIDPRLNRYILCCDDARFINHSDKPNIQSDFSLDRYGIDAAARDIETGEELTIDYESVEGFRPNQSLQRTLSSQHRAGQRC